MGTSTSVGESEAYRQRLHDAVGRFSRTQPVDAALWHEFAAGITTVAADVSAPADWAKLRDAVLAVERERGTGGNRLFYLAVPPASFAAHPERAARERARPAAGEAGPGRGS